MTFKEGVSCASENEKCFFTMLLLPHHNEIDKKVAKQINKFLIIQRFQEYLFHDAEIPIDKSIDQPSNLLRMKRGLERAGYKFENQYNFIFYMFVLVFRVDKDVYTH